MQLRGIIPGLVAMLALPLFAASPVVNQARICTGYAEGTAQEWDPMNEVDRAYVGHTRSEPGQWFLAEPGKPPMVGSQEDLQRLIYHMAYSLQSRESLNLAAGVLPRHVRKWLRRINTSIYGQYTLTVQDGKCVIQAKHTPESRIMAAFRNPAMEKKLEGREAEALEVCAAWLCANVTRNMPNGLKIKRIHDALIDTSVYVQGKHNPTDLLLKGQGSCVAYSAATQLLLHMMKIDARRVYGTEEMNHVWNLVELNDEWYHLDISWNDPVAGVPLRMYNYYLLTDVEMLADHAWEDADVYHKTPRINLWHHPMRNDIRRSWVAGGSGYTLPRENADIPAELYNMYVRASADRVAQAGRQIGVNTDRFGDIAKRFLIKDKQAKKVRSNPVSGKTREKGRRKYTEKSKLRSLTADGRRQAGADAGGVTNVQEFNEELRRHADLQESNRIMIKCKESVEDWRLREIVGKSDLPLYAQNYNVMYDDVQNIITLDIEYWYHVRLLAAARNPELAQKMGRNEQDVIKRCLATAAKLKKPAFFAKGKKKKARKKMPAKMTGQLYSPLSNTIRYAAGDPMGDKAKAALGNLAETYVVMHLCEVPCTIVHGRMHEKDSVWCLLRVGKSEWYHYDPTKCCKTRPYITDENRRDDYTWDAEEIPRTPTNAEADAAGL